MGDNIGGILSEYVEAANDLSEDQTEQQMVELQEITKDTRTLLIQTAQKFRQTADTLDYLWKSCQKVRIGGNSAGIVGAILTICGGAATVMSGGAATPLLIFGAGFGFAGAGTNITATVIKAVMDSNEIKKAEIDWKKISDKIKDLETNLQARLSKLSLAVDVFQFVRSCGIYGWIASSGQATAKEGAKAGAQLADDIAGAAAKAGAQAADDIAGAAAKAGAQAADDIAGAAAKTGAQAADDVAGASFKAGANGGAKLVGKVIIIAGVVCLVSDVIDLGCTIKDLVYEKGSDAAKFLRAKADELDKIQNKLFS